MKQLCLIFLCLISCASSADPFWWGVGNASFQVEGEPAPSDWSRWSQNPSNIGDHNNAEKATGFWHNPEKDFDLAQELGAKMFRLSIAWERIETGPDQWDEHALDRYENMLLAMRRRGLEPLVTLHHFVLPAWLAERGGLTAPDFPEHFQRYALKVVRRLALGPAHVRWWMTFNEPMVLVLAGYLTGEWPPNRKSLREAQQATAGLAKAHLKAVQAIRSDSELPADLKISVAEHWRDFQARGFWLLNKPIATIADWLFNRQFLDSIKTGNIFVWMLVGWPIRDHADLPAKGASLDYIGLNYYGRNVFHPQWLPPFVTMDQGEGPKSDLGWTLYPEGLSHVLRDVNEHYHLPILISENGIADAADSRRGDFLRTHIEQIATAKQEGIPVIGYLHWSLTDNFEWAEGLAPRFGLVEMDYATGERKPRPSFQIYKELILHSGW